MKKAGVIAAVVLFVVVLILVAVHNGSSNKKEGGAVTVSPSSTTTSPSTNTRGYDIGLFKIADTSLLDYTQPVIQTQGTISSKECLLDGTQVVYLLTITLDELNSSSVKYYCSYQVYSSVEKGTRVLVAYQKLTESSFSVYSVTAE